MVQVILDGSAFSDLRSFYDEVERKLTKNLGWQIGRNLDAFRDVVEGDFGVYASGEQVQLIWLKSDKSRSDLGWEATIDYLTNLLTTCHPGNTLFITAEIELAKFGIGKTLFDRFSEIIREQQNIELLLR